MMLYIGASQNLVWLPVWSEPVAHYSILLSDVNILVIYLWLNLLLLLTLDGSYDNASRHAMNSVYE